MPDMLYTNLKVGSPKHSEVHITGEIPSHVLAEYATAILKETQADFALPGFRKGMVPLEMVRQHVHEHRILEEAAERALQEVYPAIIDAEKIDVLGRPEVQITKLAAGNPVEFTIRVGIRPEIKLPNYKKIAQKIVAEEKQPEVTDAELDEVILTLRKMRGGENPAELTDEFVKTLGDFASVEEFKTKLKANIALEKSADTRKETREKIAEALAKESKMELPELVVASEAENMLNDLRHDLEHAKLSFEDYLKRAEKSEEEIRKNQRGYAERQLKTRFILEAIGREENIEPKPEDVQTEAELLHERYPDLELERIEAYVKSLLRNEEVMKLLEGTSNTEATPTNS